LDQLEIVDTPIKKQNAMALTNRNNEKQFFVLDILSSQKTLKDKIQIKKVNKKIK
jgi:hypothetical protein